MLFVCPACGGEKSGELHSTEKRGVLLRYQKCAHCKSVFRKDFGLEDEKLLYGYQAGWSQLTKDEAYPEVNAQRYRLLLKRLDAQANGRCLLDVGCGKGHFVYRAQEAGWDALGDRNNAICRTDGTAFGSSGLKSGLSQYRKSSI